MTAAALDPPIDVPADGLARRYGFKLLASAAAMLTGLGVETLSSRLLGPADYGEYHFLQQFFAQILSFLSGGTSMAFATRLARRPKSRGFLIFYAGWLLAMLAISNLVVLAAYLFGWQRWLWPGSHLPYVFLGCLTAFLIFLGREATGMGDAQGLTVRFEIVRLCQRVISLGLLIIIVTAGLLNLGTLFAYTCIVNAGLVAALLTLMRRRAAASALFRLPPRSSARGFAGYFYGYSSPAVVYFAVSSLATVFDRWLLQDAGGATQQGYFSLAYQISMVISLFTSAIGPLLMREMSIAHARGDRDRMAYLFQRLLPSFAFAAAVPSCFLAYEAGTVSLIIGGPMFVGAKWVLGVMALIPIYAAYGYVSATIYFATGQMKLYRNIGMAAYVPGIVMTVVLVGPSGWFGWNLGASELAIKYLATAVLLHNGFMFFNCRYLRLRFRTIVLQQVGIIVLLLLLAALSQMLGSVLLGAVGAASTIVRLVLDASIYVLLAAALLAALPRLAGLDRAQLLALIVPLAQRVSARP